MYDIHTHLYWHTYDADRDAVIERARAAGVENMFVIGCTVEESRQAVMLTEQYECVYASVGIHPQEFATEGSVQELGHSIHALRELAAKKKVIAIGECGLEYFAHDKTKPITDEQKAWQRAGFLAQMRLAVELGLPLIVHARGEIGESQVYEDMYEILEKESGELRAIILHCYMGDAEVTRKLLTLPKVYFSFTGNITYPVKKTVLGTKDDLTETVKLIPLERIFTETDCPFLAPQSKRGERNEPSFVLWVVEAIAYLQGVDKGLVQDAVDRNVESVFGRFDTPEES